jgi:acyl-CoA synthetase (AMP-forming)/AMP-acid ligase II
VEFTIPGAVAWAAREFGDAEALAEPGGPRLSYRELNERVTAVSGALIDAGVKPGDRVALWAPNGWHWTLAALGTLGAGGTLVPVSTRFTGPEALDVIDRSGARALFVAGDFLGVDRLPGAPTIYQMILDHPQRAGRDLSSRRLAVTGAAECRSRWSSGCGAS